MNWWRWLPVHAVLVVCACKRGAEGPAQQQLVPEVTTLTVTEQRVVLTTELSGRTSAFRIAEVRPQVNGLIQKRLFTEGSDVKEGDALYQIDPAPFQAALDTAEAALARAEANLDAAKTRAGRYKEALADRAVSRQDYDDAVSALAQAEAEVRYHQATVESARINLGYAQVRSPIPGRIGASSVTDGAIVIAYQPAPLATVQQLDPIYVDVRQSATQLLRLQGKLGKGQIKRDGEGFNQVQLILPDGTPYPHQGTLQFRDVSVDPTTGMVTLRMVFPNPDKVLLPSMFVRAVVREGVNERAILIPQQTVSRTPKGEPLTMVVDDQGNVRQQLLTLDRAIGSQWLVADGLKPGERIIVEGIQKVRPGTPVREVAATQAGAPAPPGQAPPAGQAPAAGQAPPAGQAPQAAAEPAAGTEPAAGKAPEAGTAPEAPAGEASGGAPGAAGGSD